MLDRDFFYRQILSLSPPRNHVTWLLSHQSLSACKEGGYCEEGLFSEGVKGYKCLWKQRIVTFSISDQMKQEEHC